MRAAALLLIASFTAGAHAQTTQTRPARPKPRSPAAAKPGTSAAQTKPKPVSAPRYDGLWKGTTGQGKTIQFTVAEGKITEFSAQGFLAGGGCSTTSTVQSKLGAAITNGRASGGVLSGPGGVSFDVVAEFTS